MAQARPQSSPAKMAQTKPQTTPVLVKAWDVKVRVANISVTATGPQGFSLVLDDVGEVKGFGRFPDGVLYNTCFTNRNPWPGGIPVFRGGATDYAVIRTNDGEFLTYQTGGLPRGPGAGHGSWQEPIEVAEGGMRRGITSLQLLTMSEKYAWMNRLTFIREAIETGDGPDQSWEGTIYYYERNLSK